MEANEEKKVQAAKQVKQTAASMLGALRTVQSKAGWTPEALKLEEALNTGDVRGVIALAQDVARFCLSIFWDRRSVDRVYAFLKAANSARWVLA